MTGLRASEVASLTRRSFQLDGERPAVTVAAAYAKDRRTDRLPLRADVAEWLRGYFAERDPAPAPTEPLWPGLWKTKAAKMLPVDLEAAEIPAVDEHGDVYDFHALRHQYITDLARSGVSIQLLQRLARHSTPVLTARYTHFAEEERSAALEGLASLRYPAAEKGAASEQEPDTDAEKTDSDAA